MSEESVELVRTMYERLNRSGDWRDGLAFRDPAVEFEISWRSGRDSADFQVLHGIDEVRAAVEPDQERPGTQGYRSG